MAKHLPLTNDAGEVRELTKDDLKKFKPAGEVLPAELLAVLPKRGRPQVTSPKKSVSIRLSYDVLLAFKATGKGWQTKINDALRDWLKENHPA